MLCPTVLPVFMTSAVLGAPGQAVWLRKAAGRQTLTAVLGEKPVEQAERLEEWGIPSGLRKLQT
jgi:hypothetical protein